MSRSKAKKRPAKKAAQLREHIEAQRRRLQRTCTVLSCLAIAWDSGHDLDFGDAVELARDQVHEAIERLDSVNLKSRRNT